VLYKEDRIGENEVQDSDVRDFAKFIENTKIQELRWIGSYYSWTNKSVWSKIDKVIINTLWYDCSDFTQTHYLTNGLSDHTPLFNKISTFSKTKWDVSLW